MQVQNDFILISKIKEEPTKVGGLQLTSSNEEEKRYHKAKVFRVGANIPLDLVKESDEIYYDHVNEVKLVLDDEVYHVIRLRDVVLIF